jgi:hypothetical protein
MVFYMISSTLMLFLKTSIRMLLDLGYALFGIVSYFTFGIQKFGMVIWYLTGMRRSIFLCTDSRR